MRVEAIAARVNERQAAVSVDCQTCGRDSCPGDCAQAGPRFYIETAAAFLAETDPPERPIVSELVPSETNVLIHAVPRTRKSWGGLELAIAGATATPAFGLQRFSVAAPVGVLCLLQEDARRRQRDRIWRLLRGRGIESPPENLYLSVHAGINLESEEWQATLIRDVRERDIKLVIFDPIRRFSPTVDKGPSEVQAVTGFLRRLTNETGCSNVIVHHDVKPAREAEDKRRRGHRASGGDWFAACECPIALEAAGPNRTLAVPEDFKHSEDPAPFTFGIEEDEAKTWARPVGQDVNVGDVESVALHERILEHLRHNPGSSGSAVTRGLRARKEGVLDALRSLSDAGLVDSIDSKRAVQWFIRGEATA